MSHEIHADHSQQFLLPPSLEDWVPQDHPARFIHDFVGQLDLDALGFHQRQSGTGRPNYSSELLLTIWLYGYLEKIRSSRKLEHACRNHLPLIWLTGMHYPDHNSLWRFWHAHGKAIKKVFRQSVKVAQQLGLVAMVVHALDGTKIPVRSSSKSALHRKQLEQLQAAIEASIAAMGLAIENEVEDKEALASLPEGLQEARERRKAIQGALALLDEAEQKHALPAEPDARMMQMQGRTAWAFNAQAVVDDAHGIVVAEAVTNEAVDYGQLLPMLEEIEATTGGTAECTVADAGYRNAAQQVAAQEKGHKVILPEHGRDSAHGNPYHKSRFRYDAEQDCYYCPQGKKLVRGHTIAARGRKTETRVYRCRDCKDCSVRSQCTRARSGRTVRRDIYEDFREGERASHNNAERRALLRRRKALIEPLFGHIKENLGLRRWSARGVEGAQGQWAMLCLTVNLKKLYKHWRCAKGSQRPLTSAKNVLDSTRSALRTHLIATLLRSKRMRCHSMHVGFRTEENSSVAVAAF